MAGSLVDLQYLFYGGGTDAEYAFMLAAFDAGVSAADLLALVGGGGGGGTALVVQRGDSTVVAAAGTMDFASADFDVTEAPTGEANVAIAAAIARTSALTAHTGATTSVHGIADTSTLETTSGSTTKANAAQAAAIAAAASDATTKANAAAAASQPLNAVLTALLALSPSNDDFLQRKAGAWANRTIAQVQADILTSASGETAMRAHSLDQFDPPAANLNINSKQLQAVADGTSAQHAGTVAQGKPDVQEFTSSGTWTKPSQASWILIEGIGAGGGGAGGRRGAAGVSRAGGGGGSGGPGYSIWFPAASFGATETITLGAAGAAGAAATADNTYGTDGGAGGDTTIGSILTIKGGNGASHGAGFTPGGGAFPPRTQLMAGWGGTSVLTLGLVPTSVGQSGNTGGGSAGGAISAANASAGSQIGGDGTGGTGGAVAAAGANGNAGGAGTKMQGGGGGSGGGAGGAGVGGTGAAGGAPGGGGGGGGASLNGNNSGAGAAGGTAFVRITTFR